MKVCYHCGKKVTSTHYCNIADRRIEYNDSFLTSAAVSSITGSAIIGTLLEKDDVSTVLGNLLNGELLN